MDESSIIWREAKSHKHRKRIGRSSEENSDDNIEESKKNFVLENQDEEDDSVEDERENWDESTEKIEDSAETAMQSSPVSPNQAEDPTTKKVFSIQKINLKLRRNMIALINSGHPKLDDKSSDTNSNEMTLDEWMKESLAAISPSADVILFSGQIPNRLLFLAKLRKEPSDHYVLRPLNISVDFDEYVTSLLCIPIMSSQRTSLGSVDWTALVVGFSSGYVKFYTEQSICLVSLKFCDEPVASIKLQTQKINSNARSQTHFASIIDELLITHKSSAIVVDGIGLHENLRVSKDEIVKHGTIPFEPAYTLENLPIIITCQKWKFLEIGGKVLDAELLGTRCTSRFDSLKSDSINLEHIATKSCTRAIAVVGRNPFITCYRESKEQQAHSYTQIITSLLPFWSKPQPTRFQMHEILPSSESTLYDGGRLATHLIASPDRRLAVATDDFGRVMLIDVSNWLVVRLWKGYRNAQCGWVEVKRNPEEIGTPHASFLVIYAPKRGLLEVWSAQRGPRVAAFNVGKHCHLLYSGYKMLNSRAETSVLRSISGQPSNSALINQSYHSNCYLLDTKTETVHLIELPYTYSLYKYGDLKSRDHLLIGELTSAVSQDAETTFISEILHRVALVESIEVCLQRAVLDLTPKKISPLVENLIDKTMKKYDNQPGETMTNDDISIVDLCKRIIRLCAMFTDLQEGSQKSLSTLSFPDFNHRIIEHYEEHPKEVDEFAERLGWTATEVLRCLSLSTLEQSYKGATSKHLAAINFIGGEPLCWREFVSCFDLKRTICKTLNKSQTVPNQNKRDQLSISLRDLSGKFLNEDKVVQTAISLYSRLAEKYYKSMMNNSQDSAMHIDFKDLANCYNYIDPSSRLALLFQFWLSTKLCNHWKMWVFLQDQVGRISDELRVAVMARDGDDALLIEAWKRIYQLILESDNIFAAIVATTVIKSDTLRMLSDKEKREKMENENDDQESKKDYRDNKLPNSSSDAIDWECLCIDAERMSLLNQQLEDVFLLSLLLNYSSTDKRIVERVFLYRVPRISLANILRGGPTVVSELVAQWAAQPDRNDNIDLVIFTEDYGLSADLVEQQKGKVVVAQSSSTGHLKQQSLKFLPRFSLPRDSRNCSEVDQIKELLHHVRTSFPQSLDKDIMLLHCLWVFCQRWTNSALQSNQKSLLLQRAIDALSLLSCQLLKRNAASLAFKTFFQRTFERLSLLIETNPTILSPKCLRSRDSLARRELNMSGDCLEDFVRFICNLSEFLLQTCRYDEVVGITQSDGSQVVHDKLQVSSNNSLRDNLDIQGQLEEKQLQFKEQLSERLLCQDDWWSTPTSNDIDTTWSMQQMIASHKNEENQYNSPSYTNTIPPQSSNYYVAGSSSIGPSTATKQAQTTMNHSAVNNYGSGPALVQATLSVEKLYPISVLLELNRLASLMDLIFKLKIIKSYPLTLIGEDSRQQLKLNLQQSPSTGAEIQLRSGSLVELRQRFARRCIVNIVAKLSEEIPSIVAESEEDIDMTVSMVASYIESMNTVTSSRTDGSAITSSNNLFTRHSARRRQRASKMQEPNMMAASESDINRTADAEEALTSNNLEHDYNADDEFISSNLEQQQQANNESMLLFANLLSLSNEWQLAHDELQLEFAFELFRCNHDKLAKQLIIRIQDKQMLANGLMKICSQRILVLFGLSPRGLSSTNQWRQRLDKWSMFQPNVSSWLKSVQEEELHHELAELNFSSPGNELKADKRALNDEVFDDEEDAFVAHIEGALGLRMFVLKALHSRTKSILELVTNYLDGQTGRLLYDLLQLFEVQLFEKQFLPLEREFWREQGQPKVSSSLRQKPTTGASEESTGN